MKTLLSGFWLLVGFLNSFHRLWWTWRHFQTPRHNCFIIWSFNSVFFSHLLSSYLHAIGLSCLRKYRHNYTHPFIISWKYTIACFNSASFKLYWFYVEILPSMFPQNCFCSLSEHQKQRTNCPRVDIKLPFFISLLWIIVWFMKNVACDKVFNKLYTILREIPSKRRQVWHIEIDFFSLYGLKLLKALNFKHFS